MIRSRLSSNAITNKIKTYFTVYFGKETNGELADSTEMKPMRNDIDSFSVAGTAEEITSDIDLPETRIASTPEIGTESNSGDMATEWNIDEQDDLFAAVFCGEWKNNGETKKSLTLGDVATSFSVLKKYSQNPVAWQLYKKEYINQLTIDFATDSFVKLTWNLMGSNNPKKVFEDPLTSKNVTYADILKTKSFLTKKGWLKIGDSVDNLVQIRQSPSMNITINNNLERTPALFEEESIENSLGNFDVTGSIDVYNVDDLGHDLYNDAVEGKDKVVQVKVSRSVGTVTTSYTLTLNVHLGAPTESKNGNKLQFSIPITVNDNKDLLLEKEVIDSASLSSAGVATPIFNNVFEDVSYTQDSESASIDGSATVSDNGTITYSWSNGTSVVSKEAIYTPPTSDIGETTYTVTATNTLSTGEKATASQSVKVTVTE